VIDPESQGGHVAAVDWRSWLIAVLLAASYTISYLDRQVISLLIKPIQAALHISDTQFGLLQGVSFSLFYVAASLPLAWLADRTRPSRVMSACVAFWSIMTMACGFAGSFAHMMMARIGVAVGEAGLTPAALSTLADRFDRRRIATATSLFMLAPFLGGGLALAAGGALYKWAQGLDRAHIALVPGIAAWQLVFVLVGAAGLIPAILLLLIVDRKPKDKAPEQSRFGEVFAMLRRDWKVYVLHQLAMATVMVVLAGYVTWLPAAIMRSKGIDEAQIGALFGPIYLICGAAGTLSAGFVVMLRAGDDPARTVWRYMLAMLLPLWPLAAFGLTTTSLEGELAMMGAALFLISSVTSLSSLPFQYITPRHLRAQSMAVMAMVAALFGTGLGPVLAGILSDRLTGFDHPLSAALSLIGAVCIPMAIVFLVIVQREHARRRLDILYAPSQVHEVPAPDADLSRLSPAIS